uniref:Transmembrane protein n=1 Tax=Cannabis sativa TaxID=3483 RepID=A0A803QZM7_CANSA
MFSSLKLQVPKPAINLDCNHIFARSIGSDRVSYDPRLPARPRRYVSVKSEYGTAGSSVPSHFNATVGTSSLSSSSLQLSQWNLTHRHVVMLNVIACAVAISATWLFCSAIPALLAFKRAAESLEKLMDVMREELPDTMAAVRLSGMEISDLTMELSDLGQEITQGVRSSTRAVRVAEERLRGLTNMTSTASLQGVTKSKTEAAGPPLAITVRGVREGIVKGRALWQMFFSIARFSRVALNYLANRTKRVAR